MIVRNFVAITFSRLKEKPMRLSTQHHCKIEIFTICKSNFPLQMISVAFQANPNHVLELFHVFESPSCHFKFYK